MKKLAILFTLIIFGITINAQQKSGTIFNEHEAINKTKSLWSALIEGDKEAFVNYFADTVMLYQNGKPTRFAKEAMGGFVDYWSAFESIEITNDHQSEPDALEYSAGTYVQDWLKFSGIHKKTGVNNDLNMHNMYGFNDDGKIFVMYCYFDESFFEEINNSLLTVENGTVYSQHPHIVTVRKMLNAYLAGDVKKWATFFTPDVVFSSSYLKVGQTLNLETRKVELSVFFEQELAFDLKQVGQPYCIYYEDSNTYVVYSQWIFTEMSEDGRTLESPYFVSHQFSTDGKINFQDSHFSTNHLEWE